MREFVYSHSHIFDETGVLRSYSVRLHSFVAKEMKKQSCDSKGNAKFATGIYPAVKIKCCQTSVPLIGDFCSIRQIGNHKSYVTSIHSKIAEISLSYTALSFLFFWFKNQFFWTVGKVRAPLRDQ